MEYVATIGLVVAVVMLVVSLLGVLFCLAALGRNKFVYEYRTWVLSDERYTYAERNRRYDALPTYDEMMWQFFKTDYSDCMDPKQGG